MANYRRNFLAGGSYVFAVNLADCRLRLLKTISTYCGRRFAKCDLNTEARALGV
jgi:hypothetical protein